MQTDTLTGVNNSISAEEEVSIFERLVERLKAAKKEVPISTFIPYQNHVTENIIKTENDDYVLTIRLQGIPHESANISQLNAWHEQLNAFLRNVASQNLAVWTHIVRRRWDRYQEGTYKNDFANDLNDKYKDAMFDKKLFINELYITMVYRDKPNKMSSMFGFLTKLFKTKNNLVDEQQHCIAALEEIADTAMAALDRYEPKKLGFYTFNEFIYSEQLQLYAFLIDGEWHRMPVMKANISKVLSSSRPFIGKAGSMSVKTPSGSHHVAIIAIQEYQSTTHTCMLDDLLHVPFPLVISQSMTFINKHSASALMERQKNKLIASGDVAVSQIHEIADAQDDLISNRFVSGDHHLSITLRSEDGKKLKTAVTTTGAILSDTGMKWAMEEASVAASYYAQLPAQFKLRPRLSHINSRNFAGFSAFHNFPTGRMNNNQWGNAVMMFRTTSNSPYFFNFHQSEVINSKIDENHKDLANTLIVGKSGGGKTVLEMMLLAQLTKFDEENKPATFILFDKDYGASIGVRALGGKYFPLKSKEPSGLAPLKIENTPENIAFLEKLIKKLVYRENLPFTPVQETEIYESIIGVMSLPLEDRSLTTMLEYLDPTDENGINARLRKWCKGGANGWVFDNEEDTFQLTGSNIYAFDVTNFIDDPDTRTPITMYLLHKVEQLIDGRRIGIFLDEFWKLLQDEYFEELVEDKLKTIRKQDGFVVPITQSPAEMLKSRISASLIEQTATKIFLPNPEASRDDYVNGMKLTDREFNIVKNFRMNSRLCLIKQGESSVVAELNLKGFDDELAVLSGNTATSFLAEKLVAELGDDPAVWLPEFHKQRKVNNETE